MTKAQVLVLFTALSVIGIGCGGQGMDGGDNGAGGSSMMTNTGTGSTMTHPDTSVGGMTNTPGTGGMNTDNAGTGGMTSTPGTGGMNTGTNGTGGATTTPGTGGNPGTNGTGGMMSTPGTGGAMTSTLVDKVMPTGSNGALDVNALNTCMPGATMCASVTGLGHVPCCSLYNTTSGCMKTMPTPMLKNTQLSYYDSQLNKYASVAGVNVTMDTTTGALTVTNAATGSSSVVSSSGSSMPAKTAFCTLLLAQAIVDATAHP